MRFADDYIVGFQYESDARRFLAELRDRLAKFKLELADEKTRLIEFGRYAAERRQKRGEGQGGPHATPASAHPRARALAG